MLGDIISDFYKSSVQYRHYISYFAVKKSESFRAVRISFNGTGGQELGR